MVRYTFLVRLFHPLLHAGLSRRTKPQLMHAVHDLDVAVNELEAVVFCRHGLLKK
jgi:hypothetical protein